MPSATVTSKGQITIPKDVRERLRLEAGDRVLFIVQGDKEVVLKPAKTDIRALHGVLYRKGQRPRSVEEMDAGIARSVAEEYRRRRCRASTPTFWCATSPGTIPGRSVPPSASSIP